MTLELEDIIVKLKKKRPIFHSEADFQFSLAWEIQLSYPSASIRLEKPFTLETGGGRNSYLDIFITEGGKRYAIELKYKTSTLRAHIAGEEFYLRTHGAHRDNRVHFATDVYRLKKMKEYKQADYTYALMLTNECLYWLTPIMTEYSEGLQWKEYSRFDNSKKGEFKYLLMEI